MILMSHNTHIVSDATHSLLDYVIAYSNDETETGFSRSITPLGWWDFARVWQYTIAVII